MKAGELTVDVNARIAVPVEQAERALRILEWFMNDNPEIDVICERMPDGSKELRFERWKPERYQKEKKDEVLSL